MLPLTLKQILVALVSSGLSVQKLHLNWRGEPTLNPDFPALLRLTQEVLPGFPVEWHTNGTNCSAPMAREIIAAHPNQTIHFSLDGGTQQSFEKNRGPGTWNVALDGLEMFLKARRIDSNAKLGVYGIDFGINPARYDRRFMNLVELVDMFSMVSPIRENGDERRRELTQIESSPAKPEGPCFWLGNALALDPSGNAYSCLLAKGFLLGNVIRDGFQETIARAKSARDLVMSNGRQAIAGCSTCQKREGSAHDANVGLGVSSST